MDDLLKYEEIRVRFVSINSKVRSSDDPGSSPKADLEEFIDETYRRAGNLYASMAQNMPLDEVFTNHPLQNLVYTLAARCEALAQVDADTVYRKLGDTLSDAREFDLAVANMLLDYFGECRKKISEEMTHLLQKSYFTEAEIKDLNEYRSMFRVELEMLDLQRGLATKYNNRVEENQLSQIESLKLSHQKSVYGNRLDTDWLNVAMKERQAAYDMIDTLIQNS